MIFLFVALTTSLLSPALSCSHRHAQSGLWPSCRIPYRFGTYNTLTRSHFTEAMRLWEQDTCIRFVPATLADVSYLVLTQGSSCQSFVGRRGAGHQDVILGPLCNSIGNALHELGHAIGLWHEHSRPDRDLYITVHTANIASGHEHQFTKIGNQTFERVRSVGYDLQSVMHYGSRTFSDNGQLTISVNEGVNLSSITECGSNLTMGQRVGLTYKDKRRVNVLYNCSVTLTPPSCVTPGSSATPAPSSSTATLVTPATPPPLAPRIRSGNVITLIFQGSESASYGVKCVTSSVGCRPVQCQHFGDDSCIDLSHQFSVVKYGSGSSKIRSGNTVLLRSVDTPSRWVDCSGSQCVLSSCSSDNVRDAGSPSYRSSCSKHRFVVVKKSPGSNWLRTGYSVELRQGSQYLNCNGKKCVKLGSGSCPSSSFRLVPVGRACPPQRFTLTKVAEM